MTRYHRPVLVAMHDLERADHLHGLLLNLGLLVVSCAHSDAIRTFDLTYPRLIITDCKELAKHSQALLRNLAPPVVWIGQDTVPGVRITSVCHDDAETLELVSRLLEV